MISNEDWETYLNDNHSCFINWRHQLLQFKVFQPTLLLYQTALFTSLSLQPAQLRAPLLVLSQTKPVLVWYFQVMVYLTVKSPRTRFIPQDIFLLVNNIYLYNFETFNQHLVLSPNGTALDPTRAGIPMSVFFSPRLATVAVMSVTLFAVVLHLYRL